MKRGGTPGEVENALAMAAKLAREHGIDLGQVNPDDETQKEEILTHVTDLLKLRLPLEAKFAAAICVNFFRVQICFKNGLTRWFIKVPGQITFVGTAWDIEVARYVFVFLQRHFRACWNHRTNRRLRNRQAFMHGMFLGLAAALEKAEAKPEGEGLVLISHALQRRKDYLAKLFPKATDKNINEDDSDALAARYAGILEGQKTQIHSAVNRAPKPQPALTAPRPALQPPAGQFQLL